MEFEAKKISEYAIFWWFLLGISSSLLTNLVWPTIAHAGLALGAWAIISWVWIRIVELLSK